jgi:nucleotide-binding universal stress UspA family protein
VLIVRAHQPPSGELVEGQYKCILVPLDGSRRAENVLPVIALLARFHSARIHVVHVVTAPEMARQMPLAREDLELSERLVARNREEAIRYLDQVRLHSPLEGIDLQTHLLTSNNAAAALHELADKEGVDLVALSAHGHSGYVQWPYGGMVNNFVMYSKFPLLIVQDQPAREEPTAADMPPRDQPKQ